MFCLTLPIAQIVPFMEQIIPMGEFGARYAHTLKAFFVSSHLIAYVLFAPAWGAVSDYVGRRRPFIIAGLLGNAVFFLAVTIAPSIQLVYLSRFLEGAMGIMAVSLIMTLDLASREGYGRAMGLVAMGMLFGNALGAPIGGMLGDQGNRTTILRRGHATHNRSNNRSTCITGGENGGEAVVPGGRKRPR